MAATPWLTVLRRYFAVLHCTGGDILIGLGALVASLLLVAPGGWPERGYRRVAVATIVLGLGYTLFSEWLNILVRQSWAYRDLMPVVPVIDAGLSPVAQWIVTPGLAFWWARAPGFSLSPVRRGW